MRKRENKREREREEERHGEGCKKFNGKARDER